MADPKTKRRTWRDRTRGSVGLTLDCVLKSGGRITTTNDPFNAEGCKPTAVACEVARMLAILYGPDAIEKACAKGIAKAREQAGIVELRAKRGAR